MKTSTKFPLLLAVGYLCLIPTRGAAAGSRTLRPGEIVGISEDVVLSGDDVLEVNGTAEKHCRLDANCQQIKTTAGWRGHIKISYCEMRGLGSAKRPAIDLTANGDGDKIVIEHSAFHACGALHLTNNDKSATIFRNNTIHANSMVPVTNLPSESPPGFWARGKSPASKFFQGNRIGKSVVLFENTRNWLIGGAKDEDANILIGMRASLSLHGSSDMVIRGNYIHTKIPSFRWSQVHTLLVSSSGSGLIVEHNILRHGQWVVRGLAGEFRYNLVLDADAHNFIIGPTAGTHIHHNIFARYCTVDPNLNSTIAVIYKGDDIQIYNNTFDGGGKSLARVWHVPAIEVGSNGFVASLRNNIFANHPTKFANGTATIRPGFAEKKTTPAPARLGYADYNLFYNPEAAEKVNYALSVAGKTLRTDTGFGKHDVPVNGASNAQVDPKFAGPIPRRFPFRDDDIKSGKVTVSKVLAYYRDAYAPAEDNPLRNGGDPADGKGSYIGAVSGGAETPNDYFGRPAAAPLRKPSER